jgi:hypothetical protein
LERAVSEPAKVYKVDNSAHSIDIPTLKPLTINFNRDGDTFGYHETVEYTKRTVPLRQFGKQMEVQHESYYEMSKERVDRDYQEFYNGLVDNCKTLFIQDPVFDVQYNALTHTDTISWKVWAGSDQIEFFKDLFIGPPEIVEVEKRVYIPQYPNTLRECFKRAWALIKMRFKHE